MDKFPLIHDIQVTKENVASLIYQEILRVMETYGRRGKDELFAIALGPNSYKAFEVWGEEQCTQRMDDFTSVPKFHGIQVLAGPLPYIVPLYTQRGWHFAHEDAKRMISENGGLDA